MTNISRDDVDSELIALTKQLIAESGESYTREIKLDSSLQRHLGIDSLGRAELFQRIEKTFDVSVPDRLLAEAETLQDIATYLQNAGPKIQQPERKVIITHGPRVAVDPGRAASLVDVLLMYAEKSPDKPHVYFQNEDGHEEIITYGELLTASLKVANSLKRLGLKEGETVAIMQPTNPGFFYTFFGALLAGGVPVPIYPPFRMHMLEAYARTEARILSNAEVRILVTFAQAETLSRLLKTFVPSLKHVTTVAELMHDAQLKDIFHPQATSNAFIQYTSGSTSDPKGVLLNHANLLANIRAYGKVIKITPEDVAVSWLPLYHDMGLIGMWFGSLYFGVPLVLMTPFSFLNHPERWLWAFHHHRGTVTGAPNFAYELCVRKIDPAQIEGLDLSSWRMAANGAEKVYPGTLADFAKKFAPYGFKSTALTPVYGLAESTVGLAVPPIGREYRLDHIDRQKFENARLATPSNDKTALTFVSCGPPMEGHEIRIVDNEDKVLPERHIGSLQFRGPSSMQGYYNNPQATRAIFHDGWYDSGDLAYLADGEVYITGRRKDLIIKAGRNIYPVEIEEIVGKVAGIRQGCVIAFGVTDEQDGTEQLIVVAETREKNKVKRQQIIDEVRIEVASLIDISLDHIILVTPHTVPKTSSGKLQRAACKQMYLKGRLHKLHMPAWAQVVRLGSASAMRSSTSLLKKIGKFIYSAYVLSISLAIVLPLYIVVRCSQREFAAKACRFAARSIIKLSFCPVTIVNGERIKPDRSVIYAPNHASYLDSVIVFSIMPLNTCYVIKKELFAVPFLRTFLRKLECVAVDRIDLTKGLEDTKSIEGVLRANNSILIFPEGTFGYASGLRPFRLGAFKIATETKTPVCPVALKGTRFIWRDEEKLIQPGSVTVTICDWIYPTGVEWVDVTSLRNAVRSEIAKYCGEPPLDLIAAQTVAPKRTTES